MVMDFSISNIFNFNRKPKITAEPILSYKEVIMNEMGLKPVPKDCDTKVSINGVEQKLFYSYREYREPSKEKINTVIVTHIYQYFYWDVEGKFFEPACDSQHTSEVKLSHLTRNLYK